MKRLGCAAVVFLVLVLPARGQQVVDGADLSRHCDHHPAEADGDMPAALALALCYGFLKGVADVHLEVAQADGASPPYCAPRGAMSNEEARLVFLDWARDNPERLDLSAAAAVTAALREKFPCDQ